MASREIFVVSCRTESGDEGVYGYFTEYPTDEHLTAYFKQLMPDEFLEDDGDGERRMVWWEVWALRKESLPKPIKVIESI